MGRFDEEDEKKRKQIEDMQKVSLEYMKTAIEDMKKHNQGDKITFVQPAELTPRYQLNLFITKEEIFKVLSVLEPRSNSAK